MNNKLDTYNKKRELSKTQEPGDNSKETKTLHEQYGSPLFVIQEHEASSHHFDFRLEIDGTMKSWAIPKGPSTDPSEKRLAIETEDHPIAYASFEGTIPENQYGAGNVIVWDIGYYKNLKDDSLKAQYENGQIEVWLEGKKLSGGYALVQTGFNDNKDNWMLIKMNDEKADARRNPVNTEQASVLSGKTVKEITSPQEQG